MERLSGSYEISQHLEVCGMDCVRVISSVTGVPSGNA